MLHDQTFGNNMYFSLHPGGSQGLEKAVWYHLVTDCLNAAEVLLLKKTVTILKKGLSWHPIMRDA